MVGPSLTGEMFTFGYSQTPPYLTYRVISEDGFMHDPVPITISEPIMMHDFAITETYAIFMDLPMHFRPKVRCSSSLYIYIGHTRDFCFLYTFVEMPQEKMII